MQSVALVHADATLLLTGIAWVVQIVVYPAFRLVPEQSWDRYHRAHGRGMSRVLALPWVAQVVSLVLLPNRVRRLLRLNLVRTLAWTAGSVVALVIVARLG